MTSRYQRIAPVKNALAWLVIAFFSSTSLLDPAGMQQALRNWRQANRRSLQNGLPNLGLGTRRTPGMQQTCPRVIGAIELWSRMIPSQLYLWSGNYVPKVKTACRQRGFDGGGVRAPLQNLSAEETRELVDCLEPLG